MKKINIIIASLFVVLLVFTGCSNTNKTIQINSSEKTITESFTGTIKKISNGKDGSSIILENDNGEQIKTVISISNLGLESGFDFSDIELGNILRVSGTTFEIQGMKHLTAKYAITMYSKIEKEECLSSGGTYNPEGMLQAYMCNLPAKDVGKSCKDSSECEGLCLQDGKCSIDTVNFGCIDILEKGELVTICID